VTRTAARLLIVDDEVAQMRALCDTLGSEGYAPQGFSSARQALNALRAGEFDLLLTDLMMPEMDGIALIEAARQIDSTLGAIVMTGHGTIDTAVQAMQGGALDYILKPFKLNVMLPVISREHWRCSDCAGRTRNFRNANSGDPKSSPPPIRISSPFPIPSRTICKRRFGALMALRRFSRKILQSRWARKVGASSASFATAAGKWTSSSWVCWSFRVPPGNP
jgi:CheY-like chemotaxis protein